MSELIESPRSFQLFTQHQNNIHVRTDRLFAKLFIIEYFAGILAALIISPRAWSGSESALHIHVYAAVFIGALIISFPLALIQFMPGRAITRHAVGVSQMLISALWIHLSGGRLETHFHIFGSLAFLGFYRDWRVLISSSVVIALDHFLRGVYWPASIYGVLSTSSWRWLEHTGWVIFEDIFLFLASAQSVKEMKSIANRQAEAEVREQKLFKSEEEFRSIFELAGSGNYEVSALTGQFQRVNHKFCEITGYTKEELLQMNLSDLVPPAEKVERREDFRKIFQRPKGQWCVEKCYVRKDGSIFWALIAATVLYDVYGEPARVAATVQDISGWKTAEQELADAKAKAEEANQTKSAFLANMSHEIRTPLGAMLGFAQIMLEDQKPSTEQEKSLEIILRNGEQLYRIIDEILDISKIEANKIEVEKTRFSLSVIIHDVISLLSLKAREKGLELNVQSLGPLPDTIVSDQTRFRQILINVIGNAVKFTQKGHINVIFSLKEIADEVPHLEVKVSDSGPGIAEEKRARLFQPFSQGDSATSRKFGGTGLGLYLSKLIAQALGGDLTLESQEEAAGCTFIISINSGPLESKDLLLSNSAAPTSSLVDPKPTPEKLTNVRVLVVDDSPDNLLIASCFLESSGAVVECVDRAEKALKILGEKQFDVVVMDIQMPGMDGYEAVQILRASDYTKPVVALTAHAMKGEKERCLAAGFDGYLFKPVNRSALIQIVQTFAQQHTYRSQDLT